MSLIEVPLLSNSSATVRLGSFRLPSLATVRDSTLGVVWEGLLPATLSLRRGLYEADVRNEAEIASHDLRVRPPEPLDALEMGLRLNTIVPVSAQWRRRQSEAEAVTGLSAQLRDSGGTGGLAVTIMGARDTAASTRCEVKYEAKTLFHVAETSPSSERALPGAARAVHPGGYTLRIGGVGKVSSTSQDLDVPVYVSAGYQTLVFVPSGGTRLDRMSIHMLPIRHTWTGFEVGSLLLEGLLTARRHKVAALTFHRDLDIHGLVDLYPLLGLMLATHLQEHHFDTDLVVDLIGQLIQILPDHPDVQALTGASRLSFPPTIASIQESSLREVVTGTAHILSGSVAEKAMEGRVWFGAWTTWAGWWLPEPRATTERSAYQRIRAAMLGAGRFSGPLLRAVLRAIDLPATVRLRRQVRGLGPERVHAILAEVSVGKNLPTVRILDHIRFLLETGDVDTARRTLQGRQIEETAEAILLSVTSVRNALDRVRPELRRTLDNEKGRATRLTGAKTTAKTEVLMSQRYFIETPPDTADLADSLWNDHAVTTPHVNLVMEQYKLYVELADRISARRSLANIVFLTLNTAIFTAIGIFWKNLPKASPWLGIFPLTVLVLQCLVWFWIIRSYRQLNAAKWAVVGAFEQRLPTSPWWSAEWTALGEGKDPSRYWPLNRIERWVPFLFGIAYIGEFFVLVFAHGSP